MDFSYGCCWGPALAPARGPVKALARAPARVPATRRIPPHHGEAKGTDKNKTTSTEKSGQTLFVEVLGDEPLREIARKQGGNFDRDRRYRITEGGKKVLKTREEIEQIVKERHASQTEPLVALTIKVYKNTPARDAWVIPLERFAAKQSTKELPLKVTQEIESGDAPVD